MSGYNYYDDMRKNVRKAIADGYNLDEWRGRRGELEEKLNEDLDTDYSVTGRAYRYKSYDVKKAVMDNIELLQDALCEFDVHYAKIGRAFMTSDWEYFDSEIRCYLLGPVISDVLDDIEATCQLDEPEDESDA